jgi:hypothetical protein
LRGEGCNERGKDAAVEETEDARGGKSGRERVHGGREGQRTEERRRERSSLKKRRGFP